MSRIIALLLGFGLLAPVRAVAPQSAPSSLGDCAGISDLRGFTIRSARVSDPFWFIRWRKLDDATLAAVENLRGKPYSFDLVNSLTMDLEKKGWLKPTPDTRVSLSFSDIAISDCRERQLDVIFHIFSAQYAATASTVIESRVQEKAMPSEATGVSQENPAVRLSPMTSYEPGQGLMAGGTLQLAMKEPLPFSSLRLRGMGSDKARSIDGELAGSYDSSTRSLGHADWRLEFQNEEAPVEADRLRRTRALGQAAAATKPFHGMVARSAIVLHGGTLHSSFSDLEVSSDTVTNSSYTAVRISAGVTERGRRQAYAASYGLGLGSTGNTFHGDWRKHIADLSHELWLPIGDHRLFEVEQRFTAGWIQTPGKIPVTERFFGGNREEYFLESDEWKIRGNPVIRSIPANRLYRTGDGAGAEKFLAYNSTTVTVWRKPMVPPELSKDPEFRKLIDGQVTTARSFLSIYYRSRDAHFDVVRASLPPITAKLADATAAKDAALKLAPQQMQAAFRPCSRALSMAATATRNASKGKPDSAYGWVREMIPGGDNALDDSASACTDLARHLEEASIDAAALRREAMAVGAASQALVTAFNQIDNDTADRKAKADTEFVDRALKTAIREINITSVSPIFVFDVARIDTVASAVPGVRYSVGGGLRFTLGSTVSFNLGYAFNPHRAPNDSRGAFFFSMTTRNLLE